ncbi:AAA family ATPase [Alienimonas californiensis]|uniref:ATP-dependent zinc metalloprotease FtsH n=1 Tax=Alienimonas californiensis TaxID=2527989 RepID=A0A517PAZ4_9PLAN|nr:AAA family ATPase [Alienimonas californiensis]QDT16538.1 ATP-dependent zinc metalloprotease FtsH [Alienimonas californiensis]
MARSDLLLSLVKAGTAGDERQFRRTVEAVIAEERAKNHGVLAERLDAALKEPPRNGHAANGGGMIPTGGLRTGGSEAALFDEIVPRRGFGDLVLGDDVRRACNELVEEQQRVELLRSYGLEPRHRVLLSGPPGNGKTSLAEALADALIVPLLRVRYDALIGSYLGETAARLRRLFDVARTRRCVLFFDEFDAVGKERGDEREAGEIKRVVNSLLLAVDDMPSHVVLVTATNHSGLLDRAVWRRFEVRLELPPPTRGQREAFLTAAFARIRVARGGPSPQTLAGKLDGASYSELDDFVTDIARRAVLAQPDADVRAIVRDRLRDWERRARPE